MSEKKILFTDIDDTLVCTDKSLSAENRASIDEFLCRGNILVISTGRALSGAVRLMKRLDLYGLKGTYVSSYNGGTILNSENGEILFKKTIPLSEVREVFGYAREFGIHIQSYHKEFVVSESMNDTLKRYLDIQQLEPMIVESIDSAEIECPAKLLAMDFKSPEHVDAFREFLMPRTENRLDLFKSNPYLLEIVPHGINKGNALRHMAEALGIPLADTISAGDAENDIPMIQAAGVGCAVANADPRLKELADYVTERDNNHGAIAEILERFADIRFTSS